MKDAPDVLSEKGRAEFPDLSPEERRVVEQRAEMGDAAAAVLLKKNGLVYANQKHSCYVGHCGKNGCRYLRLRKQWG